MKNENREQGDKRNQLILTPNDSMGGLNRKLFLSVATLINVFVGAAFVVMGAWPVALMFAMPVAGLWGGFLSLEKYFEQSVLLDFDTDKLTITHYHPRFKEPKQISLQTAWTKVAHIQRPVGCVRFSQSGKHYDVGEFLPHDELETLVPEIKRRLRSLSIRPS